MKTLLAGRVRVVFHFSLGFCLLVGLAARASAASIYWNGTGVLWNTSLATAWSTDPNASGPNQLPADGDDIFFSTTPVTSAQNLELVTNNFKARSLTFRGTNPSPTVITLGAANKNFMIGEGGLTIEAGAGPVTMGSTVQATPNLAIFFNAAQNWVNNSSNQFTYVDQLNVGTTTVVNGTPSLLVNSMNISGSADGGFTFRSNFIVGFNVNAIAAVRQSSSNVILATTETAPSTFVSSNLIIGNTAGCYGFYELSGGSITMESGTGIFRIGNGENNASVGAFYMSGGNITVGSLASEASFGVVTAGTNSFAGNYGQGVLYVTGGTINSQSSIAVGARTGKAQMTIDGTALVTTTGRVGVSGVTTSYGLGSTGILNLNGGILETTEIYKGTPTPPVVDPPAPPVVPNFGYLGFNGGTLRAAADNATFLQGLDGAWIFQDGGTIDTNGKNVTIAQNLEDPTGNGVSSISVTGSGYIGAPVINITDGGGVGATAVAIVDGSGNITGVTITNPGVGYTSTPTITISGGNGTAGTPTVDLAPNVGGGLTKIGEGILTLSGVNTYSGATIIEAGTLLVNGIYSAIGGDFTVEDGATLGGSGVINRPVTVEGDAFLLGGAGSATDTLTIGADLTLADDSVLMFTLGVGGQHSTLARDTGLWSFDTDQQVTFISAGAEVMQYTDIITGLLSDPGVSNWQIIGDGWAGSFSYAAGNVSLNLTSIPEPQVYALLGLGLAIFVARGRRRR